MILTSPRTIEELNNLLPYSDGFIIGINDYCVNINNGFSIEQIKQINKIIKENKKQIFININKNMNNQDIENIKLILKELNNLNIDGLLFYDIGIVNLSKKLKLNYDLVWSQEHLTTNYNTCNYWYKQGIKYTFLSSEITKKEIQEIIKNTKMKLIITLFGYLPMFTSKRHLVSNYLETFNLKKQGKYIYKEGKTYPIIDNKLGTTVYSNYILDGLEEYLELKDNYLFLNNFNIDEETFLKTIKIYKNLNKKNLIKSKEEMEKLYSNLSKGFLYKNTVYKVK